MDKYYEVSQVVGGCIKNNCLEYKINWKDYPSEQDTWEPLNGLTNEIVITLIAKYDANAPDFDVSKMK